MPTVVKTRIIKIGNSQGIRIPRLLLEQANLGEEIELELHSGQIVVRPTHTPRHNWEAAFREMADLGNDEILDGDPILSTSWDDEEWEW